MRLVLVLGALALWTAACAKMLPYAFTHHLIICELVERVYGPDADDVTVTHIMQSTVIAIWLAGAIALGVTGRHQYRSRLHRKATGQTNTKA